MRRLNKEGRDAGTLGERLTNRRLVMGWSQQQLAALVGSSQKQWALSLTLTLFGTPDWV